MNCLRIYIWIGFYLLFPLKETGDGWNKGIVVTASLSPIRDNIRVTSSISCITTPSLILYVNLHGCEKKSADFTAKTYIFR